MDLLPDYVLQELFSPPLKLANSEIGHALLREFGGDADRESVADEKGNDTFVDSCDLPEKVAPGPWRSLGGYLDYTTWPDRKRFLELDRAIAASRCQPDPDEGFLPTAA